MEHESNGSGHRLQQAIQINQKQVQLHVDGLVRQTVEQTLNALLDAEADRLCRAGRYERSADRLDTRAGSYPRKLQTQAGEVTLKVPKLRTLAFETSIIEWSRCFGRLRPLAAAIQNFNILEHCPIQPWFDRVQTLKVPIREGCVDVNELAKRPGLGVELDMDLVRSFDAIH